MNRSHCPRLTTAPACPAHPTRPVLRWLGALMLAWLLCLVAQPAAAEGRSAPGAAAVAADLGGSDGTPLAQVDDLRRQLDAIPAELDEHDDGRATLADINAIGQAAERIVTRRSGELAELDKRLEGLGPAPEKGAPADAPDVAEQRKALTRQRSAVDAELKLARLVAVDAEQRGADLVRQRRAQFRAALTMRTESPLSPSFWRNLRNAAPRDAARLQALGADLRAAFDATLKSPQRASMFGHLALALLLALAGPSLAERLLMRALPLRLPAARLRRTLLAAVAILTHVFIIGTALQLAWSAITLGGVSSDALHALQQASLRATIYASFVVALGHALLLRRRSSWRLLPISDDLARRLSPFPWWIAGLSALGTFMADLNAIVGVSLSAEALVQALFALLLALNVGAALGHIRATPGHGDTGAGADGAADAARDDGRPLWLGLILAAAGIAVGVAIVALALGFVALAGTVTRQVVWSGVVFASTYLLMQLGDDLCDALLSSRGSFGARVRDVLGLEARLLDQTAVLASGVLRVLLFFYMGVALMAPLGTDPDELFRRGTTVDHSLRIGDLTLSPQALLTAVAVVAAGFLGIRLLKQWLSARYFPHTTLEPGMQSSITTLLGYVGAVIVIAAALAGLGISVERIAWVASALSVGIGFGLQAIVQNFISGLILLAERPVKVGDWVVLGDTEGDVRRVNVRATEIQLADRSTVIVPNSEFITKTVRNMTLDSAQGRVLLRLPAPLDTDARRMRELILQTFETHPEILQAPAPSVTLEGIQNGTLTFLAIGYVGSPRRVSGVRSDMLFAILDALRGADMALSPPATTTVSPSSGTAESSPPAQPA